MPVDLQVRHVSSGAVQSDEVGAARGAADGAEARDGLEDFNGACAAQLHADASENILDALKRVADEQTSEIAHICRHGACPLRAHMMSSSGQDREEQLEACMYSCCCDACHAVYSLCRPPK